MGEGHEPRPLRSALSSANVYLARHGQTAYNHEGRFQGQQEIPLDATGRAQALELAERAVPYAFSALWTSPLRRARETAAAVAERLGLEPVQDPRFMETDAGDWTDRSFAEVRAEAPELFDAFAAADPDFAFPGGESFAEQELRVQAGLDDVQAGALPALVVCHGMVIRAALYPRMHAGARAFTRVPNGAIVPLEAGAAEHVDAGEGSATQAS